ncbi:hypothetical protein ACLMJK_004957 [Lecanora helva]
MKLDRTNADIIQLLRRFENIIAYTPEDGQDRNATAVGAYQMEVESAALIRAAEDILALTRILKESWLFGKLQTVGISEAEKRAEEAARKVAAGLSKLQRNSETKSKSTNEDSRSDLIISNIFLPQVITPYTMTSPSNSMPPLPPLTLIVATTPNLGIGLRGSLPWPPLKSDLAFFARVTKRAPPRPSSQTSTTSTSHHTSSSDRKTKNAVIMGRKTWESIPGKMRPLKGRVNVVISRAPEKVELPSPKQGEKSQEPVFAVGSLQDGLRRLQRTYQTPTAMEKEQLGNEELEDDDGKKSSTIHEDLKRDSPQLGRVFIIGGAEIYAQVLYMPNCERILWTRLSREWECDTYFPEGFLPTDEEEKGGEGRRKNGIWVKRGRKELEEWVGEEGVGDLKKEGDVEFEIFLVEKAVERRQEREEL